jgi:hypothetical protein
VKHLFSFFLSLEPLFISFILNFSLSLLYFVDQVHMEADRKAMASQVNVPAEPQFHSKTTYRVKNKVSLPL